MKRIKWEVSLAISFVFILLFVFLAYKYGIVQDMFNGEEYHKIHYPELYGHWESWILYFMDKGRPIEGIYWTYLYKIFDYAPREFHTASLLLHAIASLLATVAFSRVWARNKKSFRFWIPPIILLTVFFNSYSLVLSTKISFDAASIAFITLYASAISMQNWVRSNFSKTRWLLISMLFVLLTIFNYEVAIFLFPIIFILSWPFNSFDDASRKKNAKVFFIAAICTMALVFIPYFINKIVANSTGLAMAHPGMNTQYLSLDKILEMPKLFFLYFLYFGKDLFGNMLVLRITLFLSLMSSLVYAIIFIINKFSSIFKSPDKDWSLVLMNEKFTIVLASLWIILVGFGTYVLIGYSPPNLRIYLGGLFGISILLVFQFVNSEILTYKIISFVLIGLYMFFGGYAFFLTTANLRSRSVESVNYFLGITEFLPGLKENSNLLLVDHGFSISGCGPAFMILYQAKDIRCGFFSSKEERYLAEKYTIDINAHEGGWFRNENNILIGVDEFGNPYLIERITPESDLLIIWHEQTPIMTDEKRIEKNFDLNSSPMYTHLLELQETFAQE